MKHETVDEGNHQVESGRGGPPIKLILLLVVVAALAVFFLQNGRKTEVSFLWLDARTGTWVVIGISVLIGVVLDRLATWWWRRARSRDAH